MFGIFHRKVAVIEPVFEVLGVDMHNHLVPGVDDGSKDIEMSFSCIRTLSEAGFRKMYVTPHFQFPRFPNDEEDIKHRFEELNRALQLEEIDMELLGVGGEYRIDDGFDQRVQSGGYLTIGKEEYMLVELSLHHPRMGFDESIFSVQMQDREVILAHPERYMYLSATDKKLERLKEQGVLFQCNILSISGFYGHVVKEKALRMIENGWIDFLGTDMHNETYANALREATRNRSVRKVLDKYEFMNSRMV